MSVISMLKNLTHRTSSKDYFGHLSEVQAPYLICEKQRRFSYLIFHRTVVFQQGNKLNNMAEKSILFFLIFIRTSCNSAVSLQGHGRLIQLHTASVTVPSSQDLAIIFTLNEVTNCVPIFIIIIILFCIAEQLEILLASSSYTFSKRLSPCHTFYNVLLHQ